jgi:hypothetical protein
VDPSITTSDSDCGVGCVVEGVEGVGNPKVSPSAVSDVGPVGIGIVVLPNTIPLGPMTPVCPSIVIAEDPVPIGNVEPSITTSLSEADRTDDGRLVGGLRGKLEGKLIRLGDGELKPRVNPSVVKPAVPEGIGKVSVPIMTSPEEITTTEPSDSVIDKGAVPVTENVLPSITTTSGPVVVPKGLLPVGELPTV